MNTMDLKVEVDDRVRLISAAMLLTKFAHENDAWKYHELKVKTLEYLKGHHNHPCAAATREIAESNWMSAFYSYAVLLKGDSQRLHIDPTIAYGLDFIGIFENHHYARLLSRLFCDADLGIYWSQTRDLWDEVQADCQTLIDESRLQEFLSLFYGPSEKSFRLVPSPLDPATFGFAATDGSTAFSIVGPPAIGDSRKVQYRYYARGLAHLTFHEFSHALLQEARADQPVVLDQTKPLQKAMTMRGYFPRMYSEWEEQFDEIFIRAATALYREQVEGAEAAEQSLNWEVQEYGIDLINPMFRCLREYLEQRMKGRYSNLSEYLPALPEALVR